MRRWKLTKLRFGLLRLRRWNRRATLKRQSAPPLSARHSAAARPQHVVGADLFTPPHPTPRRAPHFLFTRVMLPATDPGRWRASRMWRASRRRDHGQRRDSGTAQKASSGQGFSLTHLQRLDCKLFFFQEKHNASTLNFQSKSMCLHNECISLQSSQNVLIECHNTKTSEKNGTQCILKMKVTFRMIQVHGQKTAIFCQTMKLFFCSVTRTNLLNFFAQRTFLVHRMAVPIHPGFLPQPEGHRRKYPRCATMPPALPASHPNSAHGVSRLLSPFTYPRGHSTCKAQGISGRTNTLVHTNHGNHSKARKRNWTNFVQTYEGAQGATSPECPQNVAVC